MRIPNYIVKTQPCCDRRGSVTKTAGDIFETFDMANHLPSRPHFGFGRTTFFGFKKSTESEMAIKGGSGERAFGKGRISKGYPNF